MIIDATNLILGRFATVAAKKALAGEEVIIVNAENAVITGRRNMILARHRQRFELGQPAQGPFFPKRPDMFVRRVIRGMVPRKRARGREAYGRVKCYISVPEALAGQKFETVEKANISNSSTRSFVTVRELCRLIR